MLGLFVLFAILLHALVMKPLIAAQEERHAKTGAAREGTTQLDVAIAERRRDYDQRLSQAKRDAVKVRDELKDAAASAAAARLATAKSEADSLHASNLGLLSEASSSARRELSGQADALSDVLVSKLIGSK
jgi:F0F1-type ATP synthase membrane subunit b/b'